MRNNRFKDAPWFQTLGAEQCIVGGAGGISSWLCLLLARAGFKIMVYDFDTIEHHNLGGQFYGISDIHKLKVNALKDRIAEMGADYRIEAIPERFDEFAMVHKYMFSGFDNMQARTVMFEMWYEKQVLKSANRADNIFIDGRLLAEQMQIFCITGDNQYSIDKYRKEYLFDDSEVEDGPCSFKQTTHAATIIAGLMTGFFTNHITNIREGKVIRTIPFYTEYFIPLNLFSTYDNRT